MDICPEHFCFKGYFNISFQGYLILETLPGDQSLVTKITYTVPNVDNTKGSVSPLSR